MTTLLLWQVLNGCLWLVQRSLRWLSEGLGRLSFHVARLRWSLARVFPEAKARGTGKEPTR